MNRTNFVLNTTMSTLAAILLLPATLHADPGAVPAAAEHRFFAEASGAFGVQFGTSPYLPEGDGTSFHHPMTNGFAFGASVGVEVLPGLDLIANFERTSASSRDGSVENALDRVDGNISYHTVVIGLRSARQLGPGLLFGELAAGLVLPFHTELQYDYAAALGGLPMPITGSGSKRDEYNIGFGAHGSLGYKIALGSRIYLATAIKLKGFSTTNDGKRTILKNFVTDFAAMPPSAVSAEISYDKNGRAPSTYSVQDLRLQLAVGARF